MNAPGGVSTLCSSCLVVPVVVFQACCRSVHNKLVRFPENQQRAIRLIHLVTVT